MALPVGFVMMLLPVGVYWYNSHGVVVHEGSPFRPPYSILNEASFIHFHNI